MLDIRKIAKRVNILRIAYLLYHRYLAKIREYYLNKPYNVKREYIKQIAEKHRLTDTFIETGTYLGDTIEFMKPYFKKLISIELSTELAEKATNRFISDDNIQIINGDSSVILQKILKEINSPCIFWLDGHYSNEFYIGDELIKTAKGDVNTPILKELTHIFNHDIQAHIILIDDSRLFKGENDYPSITSLKKFVMQQSNFRFSSKNDIITIIPKIYDSILK